MIYLLGGYQTDFAKNWNRQGLTLFDMMKEGVLQAFEQTQIDPKSVDSAHVGNFVGELFCNQGQLGGMLVSIHKDLIGIPTVRHEAACASGSMAIMAAMMEIEAERSNLVLVNGIEFMKNVNGKTAAEYLGAAAWSGQEGQSAQYMWPYMFDKVGDYYREKYGLKQEHLAEISKINFANAKRNRNAQTRNWTFDSDFFSEKEEHNPIIEGSLRKSDCGQVTDGSATIFLASQSFAQEYAKKRNIPLCSIPRIKGWGHKTAPLKLQDKLDNTPDEGYDFPHLHQAIQDALKRAKLKNIQQVDAIETHDCFSITEYIAIEHFGLTKPGEAWQAIEDGTIAFRGKLPINPSGGLIGLGHPVGATGVRMALDAYKQTSNQAGAYQVENAKNVAMLNIGGSLTTIASFVIGID